MASAMSAAAMSATAAEPAAARPESARSAAGPESARAAAEAATKAAAAAEPSATAVVAAIRAGPADADAHRNLGIRGYGCRRSADAGQGAGDEIFQAFHDGLLQAVFQASFGCLNRT